MPEKKMKNIKRELIEQKLNLVVEKLMNLGGPENEAELKTAERQSAFLSVTLGLQSGTGRREWGCTDFSK